MFSILKLLIAPVSLKYNTRVEFPKVLGVKHTNIYLFSFTLSVLVCDR